MRTCWSKMNFDMEKKKPGILDCMPELKAAVDLSKDIKELKKQLMDIVEDFREKYDAIHVVVDIEMYKFDKCDNCCDVSIKV